MYERERETLRQSERETVCVREMVWFLCLMAYQPLAKAILLVEQ